jgi:replicative DNA helicase
MTVEQMMRRHVADILYERHGNKAPSYSAMRKKIMSEEQQRLMLDAKSEFRDLNTLVSVYRSGVKIADIRNMVRRQKVIWARHGIKLGLITVDHVGLVKSSTANRGRTESQGEVAREMKELGGELDAAIFALVQLNRQVESRDDKRPMLADLRDSGEWEENADGVIGFYRDSYYAKRELEPKSFEKRVAWEERCASNIIDAILMKIREGEMQTVKLWADMARNAIRGFAPELAYGSGSNAGLFD